MCWGPWGHTGVQGIIGDLWDGTGVHADFIGMEGTHGAMLGSCGTMLGSLGT